jgi:predicted CxxxxCH...CXXCH cytochrome family protein
VEVTWGTLARTGRASPSWNGTGCSLSYCHGNFTGGNAAYVPSWTAPVANACGTCHGLPPTANGHTTSTACGTCHTGYTSSSVNAATHLNGVVDVTASHPAGWSAASQHGYQANLTGLAGCKGCHGTDLAGGSTGVSCTACHTTAGFPTWDTNCTFCHGNRGTGRQSPPLDVQGRSNASNTSVGRHDMHVGTAMMSAITCGTCHPARSASVIADASHVDGNGVAEVTPATLAGVAGTYTRTGATAATCTNYCHSNFPTTAGGARIALTPSWVGTSAASCTSCHSTKSSRHSTHSSYACSVCHGTGYTSTSVTGAAIASHVDGTKTIVTTASGTGIRTWTAGSRSCAPSCHGTQTWQ